MEIQYLCVRTVSKIGFVFKLVLAGYIFFELFFVLIVL